MADVKLNDITDPYAAISPAASGKPSMLVSGIMIAVIILFIILAIVLGVYYGMQSQNKPASLYDPAYHNMAERRPAEEIQVIMGGGQQPVAGPLGYERNSPRQLTAAEMAAISLGQQAGANKTLGGGNTPPPPASGGNSNGAPVLNIGQLEKLVADGENFTVILFSKTCPACTRLVGSVGEWAKDGSLNNMKVALLETSEWGKANSGVVKDALATKAVPLSVNFRGGVATDKQLGAVPKDAFMKFIAQ